MSISGSRLWVTLTCEAPGRDDPALRIFICHALQSIARFPALTERLCTASSAYPRRLFTRFRRHAGWDQRGDRAAAEWPKMTDFPPLAQRWHSSELVSYAIPL